MLEKRILFLSLYQKLAERFWTPENRALAHEYGFDIVIPAAAGDLFNPDWRSLMRGCDGLITSWRSPVCTREFLSPVPEVKIIGHAAGSVVAVADESTFLTDVKVTTANTVMAELVAEWSLMMTLIAQRNLSEYAHFGASPLRWSSGREFRDIGKLTIGIWGMGDIARHLLRMLKPLHPGRILVFSNNCGEAELAAAGARKASSLEELLAQSDIFHSLAGLTPRNLHRIGAEEFALLKNGAVFVNAGRAGLTSETALIDALRRGRIRAILDVYDDEPLPEESPLRTMPNVILTPHNAGHDGTDRYLRFILEEFRRFFRGEPLHSEISRERFLSMTNERLRFAQPDCGTGR